MTVASVPATKQDVEEIIGRVAGEIIGTAMQTISEHINKKFAEVDRRFDRLETRMDKLESRMNGLEDKMETIGANVDHHAIDIRELQRKAA